MKIGEALFVILALLMLLASPASFLNPIRPAVQIDFPMQNNTTPGIAIPSTGGFNLMPSTPIFNYLSKTQNVKIASNPMVLLPPFQVMFRGPTILNGYAR